MAAARVPHARLLALIALLRWSSTGTLASSQGNSTAAEQGYLVAWPPLVGTCGSATFASYPLGAQAPPSAPAPPPAAELVWSLGPETSGAALAPLRSTLQSASSSRRQLLVLGPAELEAVYAAVKAGPDRFKHGVSVVLQVQLSTKDASGTLRVATASVELRDGEPLPSIEAVGAQGTSLSLREDQRITLEVRTGEVAPSCSGSPRRVGIAWEYTRPDMAAWVSLPEAQPALSDEAREVNKVSLAPLTFPPHSRHMFRATAFYEGSPDVRWPLPSVVFRVSVVDRAPPRARVTGPSHPYLQCDFTLDASSSVDPMAPPGSSLAYRWSCRPLDQRMDALVDACNTLRNFAAEMVWRADGYGASGPTLRVAGGHLPVGSYLFSAEVRRRYGAGHTGPRTASSDTAHILVTVVGGARPPVAISVPWAEAGRISVEDSTPITVRAHVEGSERYGCQVNAGWVWSFAMQATSGQVRFPALLASTTQQSSVGPPTEVTTHEFRRELLVPGQTYRYALLWAPRWVELERLRQRQVDGVFLPSDITDVKMLLAATSAPFVADGPPTGGRVAASPASGEAVKTLFSIETSLWSDELPGQLSFAFYRLPLARARDVNGSVQVDWDDASSARYWARLGGRLLAPWSSARSVQGVLLPPGDHLIAVRARDALGSTAYVYAMGPSLSGASSFSVLDAESALNTAAATSSLDRLLGAVGAVSEAASAPGARPSSAAERQALADAVLNAFEASVRLAGSGAGSQDPQRLPQVLAAAARGGSLGTGPVAMERVTTVLEGCLSLLSGPGAALGVAQEVGDAMLSALAAASVGLGDPATTQAAASVGEGGVSAGDRLVALARRLGKSALLGLADGEAQTLSGDSVDGTVDATLSLKLAVPGGVGPNGTAGNYSGILASGLQFPLEALGVHHAGAGAAPRQLQGNASCGSVGVQRLEWLGGNPYRWADPALEHNALVLAGHVVTTLYFWQCGEAATLQATESSALRVEMRIPAGATTGERPPACLLFDMAMQAWVSSGVQAEEDPNDASLVTCVVSRSSAAASGVSLVLLPEGLPVRPTQAPPPPPANDLTLLFIGVGCGVALFLFTVCLGAYCWRRRRRKFSKVSDAKLTTPDGEWKLEDVGKDSPDSKAFVRSQDSAPSRVVATRDQRGAQDSGGLRGAATAPPGSGDAPNLPLVLSMLESHPRARQPQARETSRERADRMMALADSYATPPRSQRLRRAE